MTDLMELIPPLLREILPDLSYKPGTSFQIEDYESNGMPWLVVRYLTKNSREPSRGFNFPGGKMVTPRWWTMSKEQIFEEIDELLKDMEDHERGEWFQYKGEPIFDPHKEV